MGRRRDGVGRRIGGCALGIVVVLAGLVFHGGWLAVALITLRIEKRHRGRHKLISIA